MAEKFAIQKLNGRNWQTWNIRIEALLSREDMWSVVTNAIPVGDARKPEWVAQDRKARSTILLLIEDNQFPIVKGSTHAKEVYDKLKAYHLKTTRSFRVSLLKRLCSTNLTERGDLEQHVLELDDLFDRLQEAGMDLASDVRVCMLLRSLPSSFDHLVAALDLQSDKDLTLDTVKSKLSDEYHRRQERDGGGELKVEKAMRSAEQCEKVCYQCKKPGHLMRNCRLGRRRSVTPAKKEENGRAKAAHIDAKAVAFTAGDPGDERAGWVIDSGASAHMTSDRSIFTSLREFAGGWITLADGKKTQILGEGSVVLFGLDGEEDVVKIEVKEVKFVPGLSTNLISVSKLAHNGLKVFFDDVGCQISDPSGRVEATGDRRGGMYFLCLAEASAGQHTESCQHLWQRRLGHRDLAAAERINNEQLATGMKVRDCGNRSVCECCLEGKSAKAPFSPVTERNSTQILDIVRTDLCGPIQMSTQTVKRYVMHLIDDVSRCTSEAVDRIKVRWTENRTGRKMQINRLEGGNGFDSKELRKCDAKFIELSNRSSQVELPAARPPAVGETAAVPPAGEEPAVGPPTVGETAAERPAAETPAAEEEIELLPCGEKLEEVPEEENEGNETVSDLQDAVPEEEPEDYPAPTGGADGADGGRPKRYIQLPKHLDEYEVGVASCAVEDPENYKEAMKKPEWRKAMQELAALPGRTALGKEELVCRLRRSIYGLRQSARCWNRKLNEVLTKLGFKAADADPCLYRMQQGGTTVLLHVYVDDLLVGSTREADIDRIFRCLQREFELTNLGSAKHFLGMEVKRDDGCYKVRVKNHIDKLLTKFGMEQAKTTKSSMDPGYLKAEEPSTPFGDQTKYRSLVGGLMYIACTARPDIAVVAAILGRKFSAPNEADWTAAKRVLRYLKATREYYLRLGGEPGEALVGHSDADWAGDPGNRRSTSGFVFTFGGGVILWASLLKLCVTKQIALEYCPTDRMVADLFTKPLGPLKLGQFCGTLGLLA